ncbi:hypothetical protein PR001_g29835 [Phytophthora rubi]|uniref:Uncharacterized protein n=1 Tax=Phytophthora rubi TaxID=129364 RepID=A0A6A3GYU4_9STRA|nr:hypothetical protein PR001_g29835 [Phytophthora rubi]
MFVTRDCKVELQRSVNVIMVDWISYALQQSAGTNAAVINAVEFLKVMDDILGACAKGVPAKLFNSLSVPYAPDHMVEDIRPDTLALVSVPRQHIISCSLKKKAKRGASMFTPPNQDEVAPQTAPQTATKKRKATSASVMRRSSRQKVVQDATSDDSEDESVPPTSTDDVDIRVVRRDNRAPRYHGSE